MLRSILALFLLSCTCGICTSQDRSTQLERYVDRDLRKLDKLADLQLVRELDRILPHCYRSNSLVHFEPWRLWRNEQGQENIGFILVEVTQPLTDQSAGIVALHALDASGKWKGARSLQVARKHRVYRVEFGNDKFLHCPIIEIQIRSANGARSRQSFSVRQFEVEPAPGPALALRDPKNWGKFLVDADQQEKLEALYWLASVEFKDEKLSNGEMETHLSKLAGEIWKQPNVRETIKRLAQSSDGQVKAAANSALLRSRD